MNTVNENGTKAVQLWGNGTPRTFRAIWAAEEMGIPYKLNKMGPRTGETLTEDYTAMNPKQKIPYLRDGSFGLSESVAMTRYLFDKYGTAPQFYRPETAEERAKYDEWVYFIYGEIDETSLYIMRRHIDLKEIYGDSPSAVEGAKIYLDRQLKALAEMLDGPYVMGDLFGLPDVILMSCLDWALLSEIDVPEKIKHYHSNLSQRPAYTKAVEINYF